MSAVGLFMIGVFGGGLAGICRVEGHRTASTLIAVVTGACGFVFAKMSGLLP